MNQTMYRTRMILHAVRTLNVQSICHYYLERGHTENEGDSVHALIERSAKRVNVHGPSQWYTLVRMAKKKGEPYSVTEIQPLTYKRVMSYVHLKQFRHSGGL